MDPHEFRSSFRARLIGLRDRRPKNPDDVRLFPEGKTRTKCTVRSADCKNGELRDLIFPNGSKLHFSVSFEEIDKGWQATKYSFHFEYIDRQKRWFRYDLDPDAADSQKHPLAHLHVEEDEPRFPTQPIDLLDLLEFLIQQELI
jgi:hypothetical protein